MRRSRALGVLTGALLLAVPAFASPQFQSTFVGTYASQKPGRSSGFEALATWSDPGEPGGRPKEVNRIKVDFAPGGD